MVFGRPWQNKFVWQSIVFNGHNKHRLHRYHSVLAGNWPIVRTFFSALQNRKCIRFFSLAGFVPRWWNRYIAIHSWMFASIVKMNYDVLIILHLRYIPLHCVSWAVSISFRIKVAAVFQLPCILPFGRFFSDFTKHPIASIFTQSMFRSRSIFRLAKSAETERYIGFPSFAIRIIYTDSLQHVNNKRTETVFSPPLCRHRICVCCWYSPWNHRECRDKTAKQKKSMLTLNITHNAKTVYIQIRECVSRTSLAYLPTPMFIVVCIVHTNTLIRLHIDEQK